MLKTRARLNEIYARHTGQDLKAIEEAMDRDRFMDAEQAKAFGIIDEVVAKRPARETPAPAQVGPRRRLILGVIGPKPLQNAQNRGRIWLCGIRPVP